MSFVNAVAFSPDGRNFAFTAYNPYGASKEELRTYPVEVWETTTRRGGSTSVGGARRRSPPLVQPGRAGYWRPAGRKARKLWDVATGQEVRAWPAIGALSYSPDGKALVSGQDRRVIFWDADSGRRIREFPSDSGRVTYRPDGQVGGGERRRPPSSSATRDRSRAPPPAPRARRSRRCARRGSSARTVPSSRSAPTADSLAVATNPPRVWDTTTGELRHQLGGHDGTRARASPSAPTAARSRRPASTRRSASGMPRTGSERSVLRGHSAWVGCVAFHPEGWCLLSGGRQSAEVKLWDLTRDPGARLARRPASDGARPRSGRPRPEDDRPRRPALPARTRRGRTPRSGRWST